MSGSRSIYTLEDAARDAVDVANNSPCMKSQRGVVIWHSDAGRLAYGYNSQPRTMDCFRNEFCRENCSKLCVHAEQSALMSLANRRVIPGIGSIHLTHIKVKEGKPVPSGPPSCLDCSKLIYQAPVNYVWLLHEDGWMQYTSQHFHELTLEYHGLRQ